MTVDLMAHRVIDLTRSCYAICTICDKETPDCQCFPRCPICNDFEAACTCALDADYSEYVQSQQLKVCERMGITSMSDCAAYWAAQR